MNRETLSSHRVLSQAIVYKIGSNHMIREISRDGSKWWEVFNGVDDTSFYDPCEKPLMDGVAFKSSVEALDFINGK